ncbi:MAG: amidohydrolase family protein [Deltaproteobacteria bacterium]|nr:amidohydrolase family protein [Deltaproteobacteria bacterium]
MRAAFSLFAALCMTLAAGCGDDSQQIPDGGTPDGFVPDGGTGDGPRPDSGPSVTECQNPTLVPPATGTCSVTAGSSSLLLRGTVLAPTGVLENGTVLVGADGTIACAACDCSGAADYAGATLVECAKGVISPGLLNVHDHIKWNGTAPVGHGDIRYDHRHEWRKGLNGKPKLSTPQTAATTAVQWGELRQVIAGTTSLMGEGEADGLLRNLDGDNLGLSQPTVDNKTFPLGDTAGTLLASGCSYPSRPNAATVSGEDSYVPHVAEGVSEAAHNEFECLSGSPGGVDVVLPNAAFVHSIGLTAADDALMASRGTGVVWSPRSNISLYGHTANVTALDRLGATVALGTDWVPSGSMNILRELKCADLLNRNQYDAHFTDEALWRMVTRNAAEVTATDDVIGALEAGLFADIAIFDGSQRTRHRAVIDAEPADVVLVMRGGTVLHGDDALVSALAADASTGCEPLDVCGVAKRVCVKRETDTALAALQAANASYYPLFVCGAPTDEPSCVPSRPGEYDGVPKDGDADGDGVPDAEDNCPKVFNPPRPMDNGVQPDADNDGVGDACDPCPLDPDTDQCGGDNPGDADADGIPDDRDNCPNVANTDQTDTDGDDLGDACDLCPTISNLNGQPCPFTIPEIRNPALGRQPTLGAKVLVENVVVTAVRTTRASNYGFYVRDPAGGDYSGLFVFTRAVVPAASAGGNLIEGDIVSVTATYDVYNDIDELSSPTSIVRSGNAGTPWPLEISAADLQWDGDRALALESLLVTLTDANVRRLVDPATTDAFYVSENPGEACAGTTPACAMVGDFFYDGALRNGQPAASVGALFSTLTGVVNGYRSQYTLDPRRASDLVP